MDDTAIKGSIFSRNRFYVVRPFFFFTVTVDAEHPTEVYLVNERTLQFENEQKHRYQGKHTVRDDIHGIWCPPRSFCDA